MIGFRRSRFLLVIAATVGLAAAAWAEGIFPVNDPGNVNWVFDQPSVVADGSVVHVAFVGDNAAGADGSPNTRVYYAAVNGGADFTNMVTTRSQVLVTAPVAIDNALFNSARHPQIALRSATELVILFQAIPSDNVDAGFKLFRALVTINNNTVKTVDVKEVKDPFSGRMSGQLVDPSFALVASDNFLRVAYTDNSTEYGNVYYARVGVDNAFLVGSSILLSPQSDSQGIQPLPRLRLDGNNNSHIVWAANTSTNTLLSTGIYYAMVHAVPVDNLAIGATRVLSGHHRWGFPNIFLTSPSNVWILAADEPPIGSTGLVLSLLGISQVNPTAVTQDGNPVTVNNVGTNSRFFLDPPGESVLSSDFDTYRPEADLDSQNRVNVAGYGSPRDANGHGGTPGRYYVMSLGTTASNVGTTSLFATLVGSPVNVGTGPLAFATQLPGDYTRPAFVHFSGKSVNFWSGPDNVVTGARNLYVTSTFSPADPTKQSGCSMVDDPRGGETGRIPGAAVLLLPAALLALRRATRKAFAR